MEATGTASVVAIAMIKIDFFILQNSCKQIRDKLCVHDYTLTKSLQLSAGRQNVKRKRPTLN